MLTAVYHVRRGHGGGPFMDADAWLLALSNALLASVLLTAGLAQHVSLEPLLHGERGRRTRRVVHASAHVFTDVAFPAHISRYAGSPEAEGGSMSKPKRSWAATRRRVLGGIGASGLAVAGAVFGRPGAAHATVRTGCCNTCHAPSISVAKCKTYGGHYIWGCQQTSAISCLCCESQSGGCSYMVSSAVSCSHN